MAEKVKKNNILFSENEFDIKKELEENNYLDDKMCISETTIAQGIDSVRVDRLRQHEISTINDIKVKSFEICNSRLSDNVKKEDEIFPENNIKIEFNSGHLFCNNCQEICHGYCTKCEMLVHVLNPNTLGNTYNEGIPKDILEIKELFGRLGVFALRVIPKGVKFGPFTGLGPGSCWRVKSGRFVVNEDKSKFLNWMRYINPARSISEQNLLAFQCSNNLYYCSIHEIEIGEELLVYFGEEYDKNFNRDIELDFIPIVEKAKRDVFGCTFCCLGFSSKTYLSDHKSICLNKINENFSIEELMQCPFCEIYLDKNEYSAYHMFYCREKSDRYVPLTQNNQTVEVRRGRLATHKGDLNGNNTNKHSEVKMYKCEICKTRFKTKEYLRRHVEKIHVDVNWDEAQACFIKAKFEYKCVMCPFKTYWQAKIESHIKTKHSEEFNYKCEKCTFKTNKNSNLERHTKTKHLKKFDYKCDMCIFKTNDKSHLDYHMNTKHLKEFKYKCERCDYKTNGKSHLDIHIKSKHLKEFNYMCDICKYETNHKTNLERHVKTNHLKVFHYKCEMCEYTTNRKQNFDMHKKRKHLDESRHVKE